MYPQPQEILDNIYHPTQKEKDAVEKWKNEYYKKQWKSSTPRKKTYAIKQLILMICAETETEPPKIEEGLLYAYNPFSSVIFIDTTNPSIVSTLHELGHHIEGRSELKACAYSVGMFKTCFPKAYEKLSWSGHVLAQKRTT